MIITLHAAKRFLERVIGKVEFTEKDLELAKAYLSKVFQNVVPNSVARSFALPGFENQFYVVHKHNAIITIIPKEKN
jgi:ABC-type arginine transport system permease subunit